MPEAPVLTEVRVRMASEEFGEVGFTDKDRRALITLEANYTNLYELLKDFRASLERRMERIEAERAHKTDIERVERELRQDLGEKADRTELSGSAVMRLQETSEKQSTEIISLKQSMVWVYAFSAGAAFAGSAAAFVIAHFWR